MGDTQDASAGIERELKFAVPELAALRERLCELGAEQTQPEGFEDNRVFDRDGGLRRRHEVLRLRHDRQGIRLTFKGPPRWEEGVKVRVEWEVRVDDAGQMTALLGALGFEESQRYQKRREEWRLGGTVIALDQTPIGLFVELEGRDAAIHAKRCGLEVATAEPRSYLELYEDYRREHPEAPAAMVFP